VCVAGVPDDGLDHPRGRIAVVVYGAVDRAPLDSRTLDVLTTQVCDPPVHLRDPPPCSVPCRHLLRRGTSTLRCSVDGWYVVSNTLCSETKLLLVVTHDLIHRLQLLLELSPPAPAG
jgi:hypothetical protein